MSTNYGPQRGLDVSKSWNLWMCKVIYEKRKWLKIVDGIDVAIQLALKLDYFGFLVWEQCNCNGP